GDARREPARAPGAAARSDGRAGRGGDVTLRPAWQAFLILAFGAVTSGLVIALASDDLGAIDLLLLSASFGALVTAAPWLWILAGQVRTGWGVGLRVGIWIP